MTGCEFAIFVDLMMRAVERVFEAKTSDCIRALPGQYFVLYKADQYHWD